MMTEFVALQGGPAPPWNRDYQPHLMSTRLSRFRPPTSIPSAETHPVANRVFQARCEITVSGASNAQKLVSSPDGTMLAATSCGGYKNRDPSIISWSTGEDEIRTNKWTPRLAHSVCSVAVDDTGDRQFIFAGDHERIKSYNFLAGEDRKNIHTLNSRGFSGDLAIIGDGRLLRTDKGSAALWNIDELETHYDSEGRFKVVGENTYKGFEDSWREEGCAKECSTGSDPHVVVPFADPEFKPDAWHYHALNKLMLAGEEIRHSHCFDCVAVDLEHGGKVASRFLGHGGEINHISTSPEGDPNWFVTASLDGYARLYDMRQPIPSFTIDVELDSAPCEAALLVHIDGLPGISLSNILYDGG